MALEREGIKMNKIDHKFKYIFKVALVALFLTNIFGVRVTYGGSVSSHQTSAKITVNATVLERTTMTVLKQIPEIVVTAADVMRGYVDIYAATRINVRSNNPAGYLLAFEDFSGPSSIFNSVNVRVGAKEVQFSQNRGWVPEPYVRGGAVTLDVSYHFLLTKDAQPGTYRWPLMITILSV
jgi:hypothetical protein